MRRKLTNYEKYIKLLNSPPGFERGARESWKKELNKLRKKSDEDYQNWLKKIQNQWEPGEWEEIEKRLSRLTLKQLRDLATRVSIKFHGGNEKIKVKKEFLLVLDEADKKQLLHELNHLGR